MLELNDRSCDNIFCYLSYSFFPPLLFILLVTGLNISIDRSIRALIAAVKERVFAVRSNAGI